MKKLKLVWDADKKPKNLVTSFLDVDFKVSFDLQNGQIFALGKIDSAH